MKALIDGDILRYEIGFAAEVGWKAITGRDELPPFRYVEELLEQRIASILAQTTADSYTLYLTEGRTFRYDIAKTKPYKGNRVPNKPWHFDNLTAYMIGLLPCTVVSGIEADDQIAIDHYGKTNTIICSRDKDLRQIPGLFFSWELGKQPSFGPKEITRLGTLELTEKKELKGTGYAFFCGQLLVGDRADNIPGADGVGAIGAYAILKPILDMAPSDTVHVDLFNQVADIYRDDVRLEEQAKLLWIIREIDENGKPKIWEKGMW